MGRARGAWSGGPPRDRPPRGRGPRFRAPWELHAAAPARCADRARDPHRRARRRLGGGLRGRPQAGALRRLHDRDRGNRQRFRASRAEPGHDSSRRPASSRRTSTRSSAAISKPPRTRCSEREDLDPPGPLVRRERRRGRGAAVPRQRAEGPTDGVQGDDGRDGRDDGRTESRRPDAAADSRATSSGPTRSRPLPRRCSSRRGSKASSRRRRSSSPPTSWRRASALAAIWQRIQGASTGGTPSGLHGSGIASVKVLPGGQLLSTTTETTIKVTDELAFEVAVEDTGDSQEVRIKVTLTIPAQPDPIVKTATIPHHRPGRDEVGDAEGRCARAVRGADLGQGRRRSRAG